MRTGVGRLDGSATRGTSGQEWSIGYEVSQVRNDPCLASPLKVLKILAA